MELPADYWEEENTAYTNRFDVDVVAMLIQYYLMIESL